MKTKCLKNFYKGARCITHDIAYWKGGTPAERQAADQDFKRCLSDQGYSKISYLYYIGVRLGGSNMINTPFKWGYGWQQERGDGPLTEQEKRLIQEKLRTTDFLDVLVQGL